MSGMFQEQKEGLYWKKSISKGQAKDSRNDYWRGDRGPVMQGLEAVFTVLAFTPCKMEIIWKEISSREVT